MGYLLTIFLFVLVSYSTIIQVFSLEAVKLSETLRTARRGLKAAYNGDDIILLFGGANQEGSIDEVLRFTISTEEIQVAGRFPNGIYGGKAEYANNNNVYYFGGVTRHYNYSSYIWATTSTTGSNPVLVGNLPQRMSGFCSAYDGEDSIYIIGDVSGVSARNIYKYSVLNGTSELVASFTDDTYHCSSAWFNNSVYIFGGDGGHNANSSRIMRFTPSAAGNDELDILPLETPLPHAPGNAVTDGRFIYVVDGFPGDQASIVKFDPFTHNITVDRVTNLVPHQYGAAIYVGKVNRIYLFGGAEMAQPTKATNEIHYIELSNI